MSTPSKSSESSDAGPSTAEDARAQHPFDLSDTIAAVATPAGRGALAVVRLSGPDAHTICRAALSRWPEEPRRALLVDVCDDAGATLDQAIALRYDAPASFTGEDAVELITHGGLVAPVTIMRALIRLGARAAEPGEFTRRAVLNGKVDVLQAEAIGDLVGADSRAAQRAALNQLDGGLSRRVLALRDALVGLEALIAYDIDFPEEDDGPVPSARVAAASDDVIAALEQLLATAHTGELVRQGVLVVLAGAPNVGKSSLFNALLGQSRAIVMEIPGTTRDAIEAVVDTPRLPLRLVDTAGLRAASDLVERLGVEMSVSYVARADVVLACGDDDESLRHALAAIATRTNAPTIAVRTKADLAPHAGEGSAPNGALDAVNILAVSAETGSGLGELLDAIVGVVEARSDVSLDADAPLLTQERHRVIVARALDEARAFRDRWHSGDLPATVAAVHLREAASALEELIGVVDVEDVLNEVFRRFCVGK